MAHILVTGSGGQAGVALQKASMSSAHRFEFLSRAQLDVSNQRQVNDCIAALRPNIIVNAAAYTAVDKADDEAQAVDKKRLR